MTDKPPRSRGYRSQAIPPAEQPKHADRCRVCNDQWRDHAGVQVLCGLVQRYRAALEKYADHDMWYGDGCRDHFMGCEDGWEIAQKELR